MLVYLSLKIPEPSLLSQKGISIEPISEVSKPGEWPEMITTRLGDITQLDPNTGRQTVTLRARCDWSDVDGSFESSWDFLDTKSLSPV